MTRLCEGLIPAAIYESYSQLDKNKKYSSKAPILIKAAEILNYGTVIIMALAPCSGASCGYCHCHHTAVAMLASGFAADEMHGDIKKRERTK